MGRRWLERWPTVPRNCCEYGALIVIDLPQARRLGKFLIIPQLGPALPAMGLFSITARRPRGDDPRSIAIPADSHTRGFLRLIPADRTTRALRSGRISHPDLLMSCTVSSIRIGCHPLVNQTEQIASRTSPERNSHGPSSRKPGLASRQKAITTSLDAPASGLSSGRSARTNVSVDRERRHLSCMGRSAKLYFWFALRHLRHNHFSGKKTGRALELRDLRPACACRSRWRATAIAGREVARRYLILTEGTGSPDAVL